jgi:hypothetical protein
MALAPSRWCMALAPLSRRPRGCPGCRSRPRAVRSCWSLTTCRRSGGWATRGGSRWARLSLPPATQPGCWNDPALACFYHNLVRDSANGIADMLLGAIATAPAPPFFYLRAVAAARADEAAQRRAQLLDGRHRKAGGAEPTVRLLPPRRRQRARLFAMATFRRGCRPARLAGGGRHVRRGRGARVRARGLLLLPNGGHGGPAGQHGLCGHRHAQCNVLDGIQRRRRTRDLSS